MSNPRTKRTRNNSAANNAVKKLKNDLARHVAMTAGAVRELVEHGQTTQGAAMQTASELGQVMSVLDALIQHLGCEEQLRAIIEKARAARDAQLAAAAEEKAPLEPKSDEVIPEAAIDQ